MIPSFAVERAQEILYCIGLFKSRKLIPDVDVYLDSPMAIKATEVFREYPDYYNERVAKDLKSKEADFSNYHPLCLRLYSHSQRQHMAYIYMDKTNANRRYD